MYTFNAAHAPRGQAAHQTLMWKNLSLTHQKKSAFVCSLCPCYSSLSTQLTGIEVSRGKAMLCRVQSKPYATLTRHLSWHQPPEELFSMHADYTGGTVLVLGTTPQNLQPRKSSRAIECPLTITHTLPEYSHWNGLWRGISGEASRDLVGKAAKGI